MTKSPFVLIYTTFASEKDANHLARLFLDYSLIACVNIYPGMTSLYMWEGEVQESTEVGVLFKTLAVSKDKFVEELSQRHPYECPCILELPLRSLNPAYSRWLESCVQTDDCI